MQTRTQNTCLLVILAAFITICANTFCDSSSSSDRMSWSSAKRLKGGYQSAPWVRDPFYPDQNKFRVAGIISAELAFVNGKWVREGDQIDGYRVTRITHLGVELTKRAEVVVLKLRVDEH